MAAKATECQVQFDTGREMELTYGIHPMSSSFRILRLLEQHSKEGKKVQ